MSVEAPIRKEVIPQKIKGFPLKPILELGKVTITSFTDNNVKSAYTDESCLTCSGSCPHTCQSGKPDCC